MFAAIFLLSLWCRISCAIWRKQNPLIFHALTNTGLMDKGDGSIRLIRDIMDNMRGSEKIFRREMIRNQQCVDEHNEHHSDLDGLNIKSLRGISFGNAIRSLNLNKNELSDLDGVKKWPRQLENLQLFNNPIKFLSVDAMKSLPQSLCYFGFSANNMKDLSSLKEIAPNLSGLRINNMNDMWNALDSIDWTVFHQLESLYIQRMEGRIYINDEAISISHNSFVPIFFPESLRRLTIDWNILKEIMAHQPSMNLPHLESVDLKDDRVVEVDLEDIRSFFNNNRIWVYTFDLYSLP